jgi:hypothetical protein
MATTPVTPASTTSCASEPNARAGATLIPVFKLNILTRLHPFELSARLNFLFAFPAMEASKVRALPESWSQKLPDYCRLTASNCFQPRQRITSSHILCNSKQYFAALPTYWFQ